MKSSKDVVKMYEKVKVLKDYSIVDISYFKGVFDTLEWILEFNDKNALKIVWKLLEEKPVGKTNTRKE